MSNVQSIDIGYEPRPWQSQVHEEMSRHRFYVLPVHRRGGKTVLSVAALVDAALRHPGGDGRFGYLAPFLSQATAVAFDYLIKYTSKVPGASINRSELFVQLPNGSRIRLFGGDNAEALRGLYFDGLCIDEVASLKSNVFAEIIRPALSDRKGWCLFIGTPHGINFFHEIYEHALVSDGWGAMKLDVDTTGVLSVEELAEARRVMSDQQYRQEFYVDFTASSDDTLITVDMVADAQAREVRGEEYLEGLPKVLGVDVARFGDDNSVVIKRWGHVAFEPETYPDVDNMTLVGIVGQLINKWKPDAVFIDGGRGEGVIDRLHQLGHSEVIEVQFGSRATNPRYYNKRTEMYDTLRDGIVSGGSLPRHADLKRELCVPTYEYDSSNRMKLERKEKIKERGMPSPDHADALALTFAYPVVPRRRSRTGEKTRNAVLSEYDPFAEERISGANEFGGVI